MKTLGRRVTPQSSELAFGSIAATSAGTANPVLTIGSDSGIISFENTTDVQLIATLDGVQFKRVPPGAFRVFDMRAGTARIAKGVVVGVFRAAGAPTSGVFEVVSVAAE